MKGFLKAFSIFMVLGIFIFFVVLLEVPEKDNINEQVITEWEITWTDHLDSQISTEELEATQPWTEVQASDQVPERPEGATVQWIRMDLPKIESGSPALLFEKVLGREIIIKKNQQLIYESRRDFNYGVNTILLPLNQSDGGESIYIGIDSPTRIGIIGTVQAGEFKELQRSFIKNNILDFIIGSALIFIAIVMLVCSLFLKNENMSGWFSLCLVILSSGTIVITYSSFLYSLYGSLGSIYVALFDLGLLVLLPSFTLFFEGIFGKGYKSIVTKFRKFQVGYSAFCVALLLINFASNNYFYSIYQLFSGLLLSAIMIIQFIMIIVISTGYTIKGNREAIIFSCGFGIFAFLGLGELLWFYFKSANYELFIWKWGIVCFLISLIIILGNRFASNHERIVEYSKQLEMFNNELQRSEKMEIISELAASVAHEVRNPLQVTRGFLQLLVAKQNSSDKVYLSMALEELDRASNIITDFLTFAKPEVGKVAALNVLNEFIHIEGILIPMANLQGGRIIVQIPKDLNIKGNSSKFKQAFINIIKNSIESLHGEGEIQVWAYEQKGEVCIHIKDNGEGMEEEVLSRLGEPYFSNKTKGTGLGLMVTFRIIEVMQGRIEFKSEKGVGTEAIVRFPAVDPA
ncbi:hypothetical protein J41TS12_12720 [Paenibacillus antibioticophila]|uniref:histidine kinase n=1 Tax=Paenibacillus antibioticophila TaxID=1274374 RepID=A0A919XNQ5_9BACL|nr:HAMP domain-containing sensor histidine kinase [Paenibacillus antibioticophila]GIO36411.1 hypothetical protein J41TS12_12720 [Paenibacillus antibioticophila]